MSLKNYRFDEAVRSARSLLVSRSSAAVLFASKSLALDGRMGSYPIRNAGVSTRLPLLRPSRTTVFVFHGRPPYGT
jgi:hypothetical protein